MGSEPPKDPSSAAAEIRDALLIDKGTVGEGHDYSQGPPEQIPPNGFYGQLADFDVQLYPGEVPEAVQVTASVPAYIQEGEIVDLLDKRLMQKDDPRNELLVISCGLPDKGGYLCPADTFLFHFIKERVEDGRLKVKEPEHLKLVVLHAPGSNLVVELFRAPEVMAPWDQEGNR